jgi:hypothetical protein
VTDHRGRVRHDVRLVDPGRHVHVGGQRAERGGIDVGAERHQHPLGHIGERVGRRTKHLGRPDLGPEGDVEERRVDPLGGVEATAVHPVGLPHSAYRF